jgi:hypothetical protein
MLNLVTYIRFMCVCNMLFFGFCFAMFISAPLGNNSWLHSRQTRKAVTLTWNFHILMKFHLEFIHSNISVLIFSFLATCNKCILLHNIYNTLAHYVRHNQV